MDKLRQHGDLFVELTQQQDFVTYTTREFSITNTKVCTSTVVYYSLLWQTIVYCSLLWQTIVYYSLLWQTIVYYRLLW